MIALSRLDNGPGFEGATRFIQSIIAAGQTYALPRDMNNAAIRAFFFQPDKQVFGAYLDNGALAGVYYLRPNHQGGGAHVANAGFMVDPKAQGQGVARVMALHALETAKAQGFEAMQFNFVVSTNTVAVTLWKKIGFSVIGTIPHGFDHPIHGKVDAFIMHRFL